MTSAPTLSTADGILTVVPENQTATQRASDTVVDQPDESSPRRLHRLAATAACALAALLGVVVSTGILFGSPVGAGDNGDGHRLFCGAGITPDVPGGTSAWLGGVVFDFAPATPCGDPLPSLARVFLDASADGSGADLRVLAVLYAVAFAVVAGAAGWAASSRHLAGALLLVPVVLPLWNPDFTRMLLSTFSEPAGLLGAVALLGGVAAAVTRPTGLARVVMLVVVAGGGIAAVWAKVAYAPLIAVAVAVCLISGGRARWRSGVAAAAVTALVAVPLVSSSLAWQDRNYPGVNQHNLVYTVALPELDGAAEQLGLPPEAMRAAGTAYYPNGREGVPGAAEVAADPDGMRATALTTLAKHPLTLLEVLGTAVQATEGRALAYLPRDEWTPTTRRPVLGESVGEQGADRAKLLAWLDGMSTPWWPATVLLLAAAVGVAALRWRFPGRPAAALAAIAAVATFGLTTAAVLGDGYFEISKHVWLAAYTLDVSAWSLAAVAVMLVWSWARTRVRRAPDRVPEHAA